jgi:transcription antitermination factor NusG
MKIWLVACYKLNEIARLKLNLSNQNFDYYLPKIYIQKINSPKKRELMFPGYIFINTDLKFYNVLRYTKGIKKILKFGNNIPILNNDDIQDIINAEKFSSSNPVTKIFKLGQEVLIKKGSLKGNLVKVQSLPEARRIDVLIHILGSKRKVSVAVSDLGI